MALLLFGEDTFRSHEKLHKVITAFQDKKNGSVVTIDAEHFSIPTFNIHLFTDNLFTQEKLIVVKNLLLDYQPPKKEQETLISLLQSAPQQTTVLFYERDKVDNKLPLVRHLMTTTHANQIHTYFEYKLPTQKELATWIQNRLTRAHKTIDADAKEYLASICTDTWRAHTETQKLTAISSPRITLNTVAVYTAPKIDAHIFHFIDSLASLNAKQSISLLQQLMQNAVDPLYVLAMIARHIKIVLKIKSFVENHRDKASLPAHIAQQIHEHPFVVKKILPTVSHFSYTKLASLYHVMLQTDKKLKTTSLPKETLLFLLVRNVLSTWIKNLNHESTQVQTLKKWSIPSPNLLRR